MQPIHSIRPIHACRRSLSWFASIAVLLASAAHAVQSATPIPPRAQRVETALDASLSGSISAGATPLLKARVTLFTPDLSFFKEARSQSNGAYSFAAVPSGSFRLGVAKLGFAYQEIAVALGSGANFRNFALAPESELGRWDVIGNTLPEQFDATDIAALRPDGTLVFCHNTTDPLVFNPVTGAKSFPPSSGSAQGCMNATLFSDGSLLMVGGQDGDDPGSFVNGIPWVKRFKPGNSWFQLNDMLLAAGRWYPGLARLNNGRVLVMGGGMSPDATRTDTCELFDPATLSWSWTGTMGSANEFAPSALLHDGRVLRTWGSRPQLYDVASGSWSNTGMFVNHNRGYPDHSDHSLIVLSDGRAVAIGVRRAFQPSAVMTEYFNPATGAWTVGTSPTLVRYQPEVVHLPDGKILVAAGDKESSAGPEPNVLGIVKRCDLFEPLGMTWRRVADLAWFREYHAVTLLIPDGRVITTGGTTIKFQFGPTSADIEAYSPPYLFRGVRPELSNLSDDSPARGGVLDFNVFPLTKLTSVVLMGVQSTTHWVDGGIPRRIKLPVNQNGTFARVVLPSDPNLLPLGWYLMFGMVDDIPSVAQFVRIDP